MTVSLSKMPNSVSATPGASSTQPSGSSVVRHPNGNWRAIAGLLREIGVVLQDNQGDNRVDSFLLLLNVLEKSITAEHLGSAYYSTNDCSVESLVVRICFALTDPKSGAVIHEMPTSVTQLNQLIVARIKSESELESGSEYQVNDTNSTALAENIPDLTALDSVGVNQSLVLIGKTVDAILYGSYCIDPQINNAFNIVHSNFLTCYKVFVLTEKLNALVNKLQLLDAEAPITLDYATTKSQCRNEIKKLYAELSSLIGRPGVRTSHSSAVNNEFMRRLGATALARATPHLDNQKHKTSPAPKQIP
jgi:hypothetical protein